MKYSDVLGRSFKALKSRALWGFAASALVVVLLPFAFVGGLFSLVDIRGFLGDLIGLADSEALVLGELISLYAVLTLGWLLAIVPFFAAYGGMVHVSDAVLAGRPVTVAEGWKFGFSRLGRTLGIEVILYFGYALSISVALLPIAVAVIAGASLGEGSDAAALGGICVGYVLLVIAMFAIVIAYFGLEGLSLRYGLIGDRTVGDALSSGWKAFRARLKNVLAFGLILIGLMYAWQIVASMVTTPIMFFGMPFAFSDREPTMAEIEQLISMIWWIYALVFVLMTPGYVFWVVSETAFFRQLTGLDVPQAPAYPEATYAPATWYPAPPAPPVAPSEPPAPPAPPAPPIAPEA